MLFEVGDGDFFVGLDGGSEALFCGLVEVVAAEDFSASAGRRWTSFWWRSGWSVRSLGMFTW